MQLPTVSITIVNWNHGRYLKRCLDSLLAQEYRHYDVTIVDNGSQDGSPEMLTKEYPEVNLLSFPDNQGFSKAFNRGVRETSGEFVLSLNPDVFVKKGFLSELVDAIHQDERVGIVSAKLLQFDDPRILDSTGLFLNRYRRPYDRGQGEVDQGQHVHSLNVFGACGAAALYRRSMLDDVALDNEYFDEDFFAYYEDVDLAWRAQLRGWKGRYAPRAVATHVRGWGDTLRKNREPTSDNSGARLALRNRYLMVIKNDTLSNFLLDLPLILLAELPRLFYMAIFAPDALLGLWDLVRGLKSALKKRKMNWERISKESPTIRSWFQPQRSHSE